MRYMLRNVIRDARFNKKRRANPGKVNRRPIIGGKVLPPAATKFLRPHQLTPQLLDEIEEHQRVGNVQFVMQGRSGGEVDIAALRRQLWPKTAGEAALAHIKETLKAPLQSETTKKILPVKKVEEELAEEELAAEETDVTPDEKEEGDVDPNLADLEKVEDAIDNQSEDVEDEDATPAAASDAPPPEDSAELNLEDVLDPVDEVKKETETVLYTESELMGHGKDDLKGIWQDIFKGKKPGNKSKQALTDDILDAQAED